MSLPPDAHASPAKPKSVFGRQLVRQSTLLLVGRILSKLGNFAAQVLIVRTLAPTTFGGFAYALSIATMAQNLVALGLDRSVTRFLPIFQEQRDYPKLFGTIAMTVITILALGAATALALWGLKPFLGGWVPNRETTYPLLLILICLAPLQALDDLLVGLLAVFAKARSIFVRRFLLAPVLRLLVVITMIATHGGAVWLAWGYVIGSLIGLTIYAFLLVRTFREEGLLAKWTDRRLDMPWRQVLGFTLPLLTTDLTYASIDTMSIIALGHYWGTTGVAAVTAVFPPARVNELVLNTFGILFVPVAARFFAVENRAAINDLYWRTAIWVAVLTFPLFAVTFCLAGPLTRILFGAHYEHSAPILAMIALGTYVNAATGFNGLTLKVFGKVRALVLINLATMVSSVLFCVFLIPPLGAFGAGVAVMAGLIVHNVLKQVGLRLGTGVRVFDWNYFQTYVGIALATLGLLAAQRLTSSVVVLVALTLVASALLIRLNAGRLELDDTFPGVMRHPLMRFLMGRRRAPAPTAASNGHSPASRGTVLVTDSERGSALCIIRSLSRQGWRVIAAGHERASIGFRSRHISDRVIYPNPAESPVAFVDALLEAASQRHVDLIVPVTDSTLLPLFGDRERFRGVCRLAMPDDAEAFDILYDKRRTLDLAVSLGVPVPRYVLATTVGEAREAAERWGWPVVLKPRWSRVYRDRAKIEAFEVAYAGSEMELERRFKRYEGRCDMLVQEHCDGIGRGVGLLMDGGRPLAAFQHRRLHEIPLTGGSSSLRISEPLDPELYETSLRILQAIRWTGPALVEFKSTPSGPKLMEVNARFWGSLPLAVMSGVDFPALLANLYVPLHGNPPGPPQLEYQTGVRAKNLALEITWILSTLRSERKYPFLRTPSARDGLLGTLDLLHPQCRYDVQSLDDPQPGIAEIPEIARRLWRKMHRA